MPSYHMHLRLAACTTLSSPTITAFVTPQAELKAITAKPSSISLEFLYVLSCHVLSSAVQFK